MIWTFIDSSPLLYTQTNTFLSFQRLRKSSQLSNGTNFIGMFPFFLLLIGCKYNQTPRVVESYSLKKKNHHHNHILRRKSMDSNTNARENSHDKKKKEKKETKDIHDSTSNMKMNSNVNVNAVSDDNNVGRMWHNFTASIGLRNSTMDKTVASQVLMYRQLLHTSCRPGLRLSRSYEGTVAQQAVLHMPWWEHGILENKRMVISYSNLINRLWYHAAILPYIDSYSYQNTSFDKDKTTDNLDSIQAEVPHHYWVDRIGFQQDDPVTDFRSGGVLSLALCVYIVESCRNVYARFLPNGDTEVMPFGITSINITDMLAKMLMFSKSVDKLDALVSSKPCKYFTASCIFIDNVTIVINTVCLLFNDLTQKVWRMFSDPSSLLVLQELSLDFLCDVCSEVKAEQGKLTVFDFNVVMEETERRVQALLNYGPETIHDLRQTHSIMKERYRKRLDRRLKGEAEPVLDNNLHQLGETVGSLTGDGIWKVAKAVGTVGAFTGTMIGSAGSAAGGMLLAKLGKGSSNNTNS